MFQLLLAIIYLSFISLGLPDSLLGAAWPTIYEEFAVPVSRAGVISMIIAFGTILSSLQSDRLTKRFGTGLVTAGSVALTAAALLGFSVSRSFWMLCLWSVPYGLGAGSVDASLNNYVALHYESRHMSWLHCMWGVGASLGPYIMGAALTGGLGWRAGYRIISVLQAGLTLILFVSLPLWKTKSTQCDHASVSTRESRSSKPPLSLRQVLHIPGAREVMLAFFCYCALEQTAGLWAGSYLVLHEGMSAEQAAGFASLFYAGITAGRALNGFLTLRFSDRQLIRMGEGIIVAGITVLFLGGGQIGALAAFLLIGLGCAPIYPCIIHSTPEHFGEDNSQAVIGVQMASAYAGTCLMPPLFGWLAERLNVGLLPLFLAVMAAGLAVMYERLHGGAKISKIRLKT